MSRFTVVPVKEEEALPISGGRNISRKEDRTAATEVEEAIFIYVPTATCGRCFT
jgi:hypothetical protein